MDFQGFTPEEVCERLRYKLGELGFAELSVHWAPGINVHASWAGITPAKDASADQSKKRKKPSGGCSRTCKICLELAPLVVLSPCGHVLCEDCQTARDSNHCPFCRRPVCCVTDGLFLD
mmetsp:Transcript_7073/g.16327  ORF Transcript_7073/g.16327 Transcript_7073/m.16327 type:complete len:119 (+) Transcript_7073:217-573(+)